MKLIDIEEHYISAKMDEKVRTILGQANNTAPGVGDMDTAVMGLGEGRIAYMDERGIDMQVISYAGGFPASLEKEQAVPLCREVNNEMHELTQQRPDRFRVFAHLPIGSPQDAATELERCVRELGFVGAMISGHYHGLPYDDAHYLPIFEKAQELDVPVYLHPGLVPKEVSDVYYRGSWDRRTAFLLSGFGIGWHYDVGMQAVRMMVAGVFDKLPDLKIILGHWGEVVSFFMYRLDEMRDAGAVSRMKYSDYFKRNVYVDPSGMLYGEQLRFCLDTFGPDHIMWGEDYPYRRCEDIRTFLEEADLPEDVREKIAHGNAEWLLRI